MRIRRRLPPPRMGLYVKYSTTIYQIYLKYIAPEDIHVYSIDEVFMDVTCYLKTYHLSPWELAMKMILDVLHTTGITATAGIGTNLYLCKIAMDVQAKHVEADKNGIRIAMLDEMNYRRNLWNHRPITDFWRVGKGCAKKLEENGLYTMGDIARCSLGKKQEYHNEELLYKLFGVNAELLIDHAWGWEPCTIADVKAYKPSIASVSSGQVLKCPYTFDKTKLVIREMTELLVLDLVDKNLVTDQIVLTVGYDVENIKNSALQESYQDEVTTDRYGRKIPRHAHGTTNLSRQTSSTRLIMESVIELCDNILDPNLLVRRINVTANPVVDEISVIEKHAPEQLDLFTDYETEEKKRIEGKAALIRKEKSRRRCLPSKRNMEKTPS